MRRPLVLFLVPVLGALASMVTVACGDDPGASDRGSVSSGGGSGGSSGAWGQDDDTGAPPQQDAAAPEAEAAAPSIPPIGASPPSAAPALCGGGAAPTAYLLGSDGTLFVFDPGTLATRSLGTIACLPEVGPQSLGLTQSGAVYVLYENGSLFALDLPSLTCHRAASLWGQLGFQGYTSFTVGAGRTADRLYAYGNTSQYGVSPALGVADLASLQLFQLGAVGPGQAPFPVDLKSDAWGRLFALSTGGVLAQIDPATGAVLGQDATGFDSLGTERALMPLDGQLYFLGGDLGAISRYDVASKTLLPLGQINLPVVSAAATPCLSAPDAGAADAGSPEGGPLDGGSPEAGAPANAFAAGDAWMGTYVCPQGLTSLALVVESIDGGAIHARFDFDWGEGAAQGAYETTGRFDPVTREASFAPGAWVSQPASTWAPVGMEGYVDLSGTHFAGDITAPGCGAFSLSLGGGA